MKESFKYINYTYIFVIATFAFLWFLLLETLLYGDDVQGYPSLIITFLLLGGLQLLTIGILGEYHGRIINETENRPANIAREKNGERIKY